jgi:hypothetical protein
MIAAATATTDLTPITVTYTPIQYPTTATSFVDHVFARIESRIQDALWDERDRRRAADQLEEFRAVQNWKTIVQRRPPVSRTLATRPRSIQIPRTRLAQASAWSIAQQSGSRERRSHRRTLRPWERPA